MSRRVVVVLVGVVTAALIAVGGFYLLRPDTCDGLPREIGGCDPDRPTFTGDTCTEVATEWGRHLDEGIAQVIDGPDRSDGKSRSSLLYDAETLVSQLANRHMRNEGITGACEPDEFLATGEAQFSDSVKQQVGAVMYEGNPVASYEEWHGRIQEWVELILSDPDQPYEPTQ